MAHGVFVTSCCIVQKQYNVHVCVCDFFTISGSLLLVLESWQTRSNPPSIRKSGHG